MDSEEWSTCTSARQVERELDRSMMARFDGLLSSERFASDMSAITRVIIILQEFVVSFLLGVLFAKLLREGRIVRNVCRMLRELMLGTF